MRARTAFMIGALGLAAFEAANVYFIMPLPGSQQVNSLAGAYFLYRWRWAFRAVFGLLMLAGLRDVGRSRWGWRILAAMTVVLAAGAAYAANFMMAADHMFLKPQTLLFEPAARNTVPQDRLVVGIEINGEARAYPIMFIGYHHQVPDRINGKDVLVTYCTVCRTGRVFSPTIDGKVEQFRLVGMDNWNAMLEDQTTGSWWRQATGVAVTGARKGMKLDELPSRQATLAEWLSAYPASLIMQADPAAAAAGNYPTSTGFETGASRASLTGTNPGSWQEKSWVVGIEIGQHSKAFDWNRLKAERVINDRVGATPIVLVLAADGASFSAFERPDDETIFTLDGNHLVGPTAALKPVQASQEFWHSWRTFHPGAERY